MLWSSEQKTRLSPPYIESGSSGRWGGMVERRVRWRGRRKRRKDRVGWDISENQCKHRRDEREETFADMNNVWKQKRIFGLKQQKQQSLDKIHWHQIRFWFLIMFSLINNHKNTEALSSINFSLFTFRIYKFRNWTLIPFYAQLLLILKSMLRS